MKNIFQRARYGVQILLACIAVSCLLSSCSSSNCTTCNPTAESLAKERSPHRWNIELKEGEAPINDDCSGARSLSVLTEFKPDSIPAVDENGAYLRVVRLCPETKKISTINIPLSRVKSVTTTANPLIAPTPYTLQLPCVCCERERTGWFIFDKVEMRAGLAYRGTPDSLSYLQPDGSSKAYGPSLFGTDRGGSNLVPSMEFAFLWNVPFLDKSGKLQFGVLLGAMPTDEAIFIPITFHPRYTFNQKPSPYSTTCNSWYVFGDIGIPIDFQSDAPIFGTSFDRTRYFLGAGIGYDIAMSKNWDLSFDVGVRRMNLPLPQIECCPQLDNDLRNPYRASNLVFLRAGITW